MGVAPSTYWPWITILLTTLVHEKGYIFILFTIILHVPLKKITFGCIDVLSKSITKYIETHLRNCY